MARYLAAESAGPLHGGALTSASFGPGATAAIITTANRGQITTGAGSAWLSLPPLPAGHGHPGPRPGGAADALAFRGGTLTVWQHAPGGTAWAKIQVINVPRAQAGGTRTRADVCPPRVVTARTWPRP